MKPSARSLAARTLAAALGVSALAMVSGALGAGLASQRAAAPSSVAVIDIDRLSMDLEEFKVPAEQFRAKQAAWGEEIRALQAKMAAVDAELDLVPETEIDARISKVIQRSTLDSEIKTKGQLFQQASDIEQSKLFKQMFDRIADGAARLARRDGIDLVLVDDRIFTIPVNNRAAQSAALESKKVLYASEPVDLTDELLTMLNNEFGAGKR